MIPRAFITEWRAFAPWRTNEQVEQDLVIGRALVALYTDPLIEKLLAFRGGTALHKLFMPSPARYSEDIDLVQISSGPIGTVINAIRGRLAFLGKPKVRQKNRNTVLTFSFQSEIPPSVPLKLKVEINCREHLSVFGIIHKAFRVNSRWFEGECRISTWSLEELLGSKLRALFQRRKGRDLFDLWYGLEHAGADAARIVEAFTVFMKNEKGSFSRRRFFDNMYPKMNDPDFRGDITGLVRAETAVDLDAAWDKVREDIFALI